MYCKCLNDLDAKDMKDRVGASFCIKCCSCCVWLLEFCGVQGRNHTVSVLFKAGTSDFLAHDS